MRTASARAAMVPAFPAKRETAFQAQTGPPVARSGRPINELLALSERPAGVIAVTTLSAVLSRISGATQVCFGHYLRELCDDLAGTFAGWSGAELTCVAAAKLALPIGTAVRLGLVVDLLITNAFLYAFPPGPPGRIAVSFTARPEAWQLAVEDSGIPLQDHGDPRDHGLMIARLLVLWLDGWLEIRRVTGETRCIVTIPRPAKG